MLRAVSADHLIISGVAAQRELDLDDVVARLHQVQDTADLLLLLLDGDPRLHVLDQLVLNDLARPVEEVFHHVEEARVGAGRHLLEPVRDLMVGVVPAADVHGGGRDPERIDCLILDCVF